MSNVAATASLWKDAHNNNPPSWWNGTAYIVDDSGRNGVGTMMSLLAMPDEGDTFAVAFQNFASPNPSTGSILSVVVNGETVQTFSLVGASGPTDYTYTFTGSETTFALVASTQVGGNPSTTYQADFSLTPSVPTITAQNTSISVAYEAGQTSLPYIVLEDGTQTLPDSLAIITPPTYGTAQVNGQTIQYIPNQGYSGPDSLTYTGTIDGITSNVATIAITILPPAPCDELGRVTRAYVSGYQRDRVHRSDLVRGEARCLCAEFRGAINPARSVVSVQWMCQQPYAIFMSNARISGTECAVTISAQAASWCYMKCIATLDNGEQYTQLFYLTIRSAPYFFGEIFPTMSGPTILTAQQA